MSWPARTLDAPGSLLIRAVIEADLELVVLPGPSAVIAAVVASGLPLDTWRRRAARSSSWPPPARLPLAPALDAVRKLVEAGAHARTAVAVVAELKDVGRNELYASWLQES